MKKFGKIMLWLVGILLVLLILVVIFIDHVIVNGFNSAAPAALGVDASLGSARVRLMQGYTSLRDLHIGNPEGFHTDGLFDLGELTIRLDKGSLLTDTIIIHEIIIKDMVLTLEQGLTSNNLSTFIASLSGDDDKKDDKDKKKDDSKPSKKVIIEKLSITGTRMNVTITAAMGHAIPIPLPPINLTDIGKDKGGASPFEAMMSILKSLETVVLSTVANSVQLLGDGAKLIGKGALAVGGAVVDGAGAVVGGTVEGAKAVGGAVAEGAGAVVGGTVEGAKAVGSAVGGALHHINPFANKDDKKTDD